MAFISNVVAMTQRACVSPETKTLNIETLFVVMEGMCQLCSSQESQGKVSPDTDTLSVVKDDMYELSC